MYGPVLLAAFLVFLTVQVLADAGPLIPVDRAVRDGMRDLAGTRGLAWLDGPMHAFADLGGPLPAGVVLVGCALAAVGAAHRRRIAAELAGRPVAPGHPGRVLLVAAGAVAFVSVVVIVGKILIARPGPGEDVVGPGEWGFFPSGHTATSAVCFGVAALLVGRVVGARARRWVYAAAVALCGAVGFALLWCDYHWLGDVLASWALCGLTLWAAAVCLRADSSGLR